MRRFFRRLIPLFVVALVVVPILAACASAPPTPAPAPPKATEAPKPAAEAPKPAAEALKPAGEDAKNAAAAPKPAAGKPIKVGIVAPFSGAVRAYGLAQKGAVMVALEDINKNGGVNGSPIEIVEADATAPAETVTVVRKLATQDRVPLIIGPLMSSGFDVAAPLANELQIPVASATANIPGVAGKNRPWAFQFMPTEPSAAPDAIAGLKKAYPNVKKVAIVGDSKNLNSSNTISNVYPQELKKAGLEVIDTVSFETGLTDFASVVTKVKSLKPDALAFAALTPEALNFVKEARRQDLKVPGFSTISMGSGPEITQDKEGFDGWIVPGTFDMGSQDPKAKSFTDRFVKYVDDMPGATKPPLVGAFNFTYDLLLATTDIMRKNNFTPDTDVQQARTMIRDGLQNLKGMKGIGGQNLTVQPDGGMTVPLQAFVGKNGKWVPLP